MTIAVYPGSFDPITNGHLDIATRAAKIFGKVIIGVYATPTKNLLFSTAERVGLVRKAIAEYPNIEVEPFEGLAVDFAKQKNALTLVRGLRVGGDFEWEFEMAQMNKKLSPECEMVCLMAIRYQFVSSSLIKEVASLGGNIIDLVPRDVAHALEIKLKENNQVIKGKHSTR